MLVDWFWRRPGAFRRLANFWPPLFFSGIALTEIAKDWRFCRCKLKNWPGTRNFNGTQFGGSLFAMTDPVYSIMLKGNLGNRYYVWDKEARIDFVKPGVGSVFVESSISDELLRDVLEQTADGEKFFPQIVNVVYDKKGNVVAVVAPALFANLEKMKAGDIAGQLFHAVSYCSFACCAVLLAMGFAAAPGFARKARFWLLSACDALVAASEFLLTPVIEALKKGTRDALLLRAFPVDSFAAWHGASQAAYLLTLIVLLAHFWLWARSLNRIVP